MRSTIGRALTGVRRIKGLGAQQTRIAVAGLSLAVICGATPAVAGAQSSETAVTIPGNPLTVYVGPRGEGQSSYLVAGVIAGNYYFGGNQVGDCGFFLAFPKEVSGKENPAVLKEQTFGFDGAAGPGLSEEDIYQPVSQSAVSGAGTEGSPFTQTTTFLAKHGVTTEAEIVETTTYVNGQPQFTSTYTVTNKSGAKFYFRALYAGDLYVNGDDRGIGVFLGGPPRFIGGQNTNSGVIGGFQEVTPWSAWQEAYWSFAEGPSEGDNGIWNDVQTAAEVPTTTTAFNGHIEPMELDNGAGVEWDQNLTAGLENNESASFTIINRTQIPNALQFSPASQTLTQGQTETVTVTALDTASQPYVGKAIRYTVTGANPQSGSVTTNAAGQATISYVGNNPGADTIQMFLDLNGSGVPTPNDPAGTATVTWLPKPPTPNSSYTIKTIRANSDGTITIVFVPTQPGAATLEVTVPTATISRSAQAAKKKCKKGQIRIKGKCRPANTVSGKVKANGLAGVPLSLTVKASSKVKAALKKGRTVHLTAKLVYKSALGGAPTVHVYHLTIKPKKKHH
jgi:hypothetical protein